jgi:hypothetical protein
MESLSRLLTLRWRLELAQSGRSKPLVQRQPLRFWFINHATGWNKRKIVGGTKARTSRESVGNGRPPASERHPS